MKKGFVLSSFDGECNIVLAIIMADSLSEALKLLGCTGYPDGLIRTAVTCPTRGLSVELIEDCKAYIRDCTLYLNAVPVFK